MVIDLLLLISVETLKKNLFKGRNSADYVCGLTVWLVLGITEDAVPGFLEVIKLSFVGLPCTPHVVQLWQGRVLFQQGFQLSVG